MINFSLESHLGVLEVCERETEKRTGHVDVAEEMQLQTSSVWCLLMRAREEVV